MKRNKDNKKSSKMRSSRRKLPTLRRRDKMKKFSPSKELRSLRNFKRKKLPRSSRPRRWNKSSLLLKLFKRLKLLLLRRLPLRPTSLD